jgi:hypothetical protein
MKMMFVFGIQSIKFMLELTELRNFILTYLEQCEV